MSDGPAFATVDEIDELLRSEQTNWPLVQYLRSALGPLRNGPYGPFTADTSLRYNEGMSAGQYDTPEATGEGPDRTQQDRAMYYHDFVELAMAAKVHVHFDWGDNDALRNYLASLRGRPTDPRSEWKGGNDSDPSHATTFNLQEHTVYRPSTRNNIHASCAKAAVAAAAPATTQSLHGAELADLVVS